MHKWEARPRAHAPLWGRNVLKKPNIRKNLPYVLLVLLVSLLAVLACALAAAYSLSVPILMYHHIAKEDETPQNSMIVTEARLREDFAFLSAQGYTALLPADLVQIRAGKQSMPQKPVLITFDDGYESNYTLAYPLLREYGLKAVIAVVAGNLRGEGEASAHQLASLTWAECREMYESGVVDIGSHTYALHNDDNGGRPYPHGADGIQRRRGESRAAYRARVGGDLHDSVLAIRQNVGNDCVYFSYPFGAGDPWFDALLRREGVQVTTTTVQRRATLAFGTRELPRYRITMDAALSAVLGG